MLKESEPWESGEGGKGGKGMNIYKEAIFGYTR